MKDSDGPTWLLRIQNAFLPLAKGIYLLVAVVSLITVIGGSLFVLYLQSVISLPVRTVSVPPPYSESPAKLGNTPVPAMDLSLVSNHLAPPTNIRFKVTIDTITAPLREEDNILGYFLADTSNGLASPDGIDIPGGRDATLFERTFDQEHKAIGLKATAALIKEINDTLRDIHEQKERNFEIQVLARDQYRMLSDLTTISFTLRFGPKAPTPTTPEPPMLEPTELGKIAGDIAKIVEPEANQARTVAYRQALEIPKQCKTSDQNQVFVANYRQAFEQVRTRLKKDNIKAFYAGLCEAWQDVLARQAAARRQVEDAQAAARRQVEDARAQALAFNNEASAKHQLEASAAQATTYVTMSIVGAALATFLSISLIVAFLAIEGHSRAIREAIKAMVRASEETNRQ
jgi:hypothetical protein